MSILYSVVLFEYHYTLIVIFVVIRVMIKISQCKYICLAMTRRNNEFIALDTPIVSSSGWTTHDNFFHISLSSTLQSRNLPRDFKLVFKYIIPYHVRGGVTVRDSAKARVISVTRKQVDITGWVTKASPFSENSKHSLYFL